MNAASSPWNTVHLVPPTPFTDDGERLDLDRLMAETDRALAAGIRVIIPGAGTGEFHSLSEAEAVAVLDTVLGMTKGRAAVLAPIGLGLGRAKEIGKKALDAGADGLLVMPPLHPYLSDEGVAGYFEAISKALGKPLWVYKRGPIPSDKCLLGLIEKGVVCGVKYAVNDMMAVDSFVRNTAGRAEVVCGTAERHAPYFRLDGARGFTSGAGALFPKTSLKLHAALDRNDFDEAMKLRAVLEPLESFRARQGDALNISVVKAGLALLGRNVGPARLPNRPLTDAETAELRDLVGQIAEIEESRRT